MTPKNFVSESRKEIIDQNNQIYKELFESTSPEEASDPYWKRALKLYGELKPSDRAVLFEIMRQVSLDTLSNTFAVLDGSSSLQGSQEEFLLTCTSDNQKLNGSLQDLLLEDDEINHGS